MVWNRATRGETRKILKQIPPISWRRFETLFAESDEFSGDTHPDAFGRIADPEDRKFAALAAATGAVLISNDEHLLSVREKLDITVLTSSEFVRRHKNH